MREEQRDPPPTPGLPEEDHLRRERAGDSALGRVPSLVRHLRRHCPWDARQTPRSLRPYLLEEAGEVADALAREDDGELRSELGDLLLNVAFQIVLAEERGAFDAREVVSRLEAKMKDRHPHVYGDAADPPDWETLKAREGASGGREPDGGSGKPRTGGGSQEEGAGPRPSPGPDSDPDPLARAHRAQRRAAGRNFDWPALEGAAEKVREELREVEELSGDAEDREAVEEEIGDLLFAAVNVARLTGVDPSSALVRAVSKFRNRFGRVLELAEERGLDPDGASLSELDELWDEAKSGE